MWLDFGCVNPYLTLPPLSLPSGPLKGYGVFLRFLRLVSYMPQTICFIVSSIDSAVESLLKLSDHLNHAK